MSAEAWKINVRTRLEMPTDCYSSIYKSGQIIKLHRAATDDELFYACSHEVSNISLENLMDVAMRTACINHNAMVVLIARPKQDLTDGIAD